MKPLSVLLVFLLLISAASAAEYADITFSIDEAGRTTISGLSSSEQIPQGVSDSYTSKNGSYWLFEFSTETVFDNLVYELHLPAHATVNYIRSPQFERIAHTRDELIIVGAAQNQPLAIKVQYSFLQPEEESRSFWWLIAMIVGGGLFVFGWLYPRRREVPPLPERQARIYKLLLRHGKLTQHELEEKTGYAKSSLSRNLHSMERRELIEIISHGMTNLIRLK